MRKKTRGARREDLNEGVGGGVDGDDGLRRVERHHGELLHLLLPQTRQSLAVLGHADAAVAGRVAGVELERLLEPVLPAAPSVNIESDLA